MKSKGEYYGYEFIDGDFDKAMNELNEFIELKLNAEGVEDILKIRNELLENVYGLSALDDIENYNEDYLKITINNKIIQHCFSLEYLILSKAIIAKLSLFDISFIINALDISVVDYVYNFEGMPRFRVRSYNDSLIDPLTLSIGAIQGAAVDPIKLKEIMDQAHHSYLLFNALIGSGAATGFVKNILEHEDRFSELTHEICDSVLGSLTYIDDKSHLPGGNIDRYFQATKAFDPLFVRHELPVNNTWEFLIAQASSTIEGSRLSREIVEHIFSKNFLAHSKEKVARLLYNLDCLADQEYDDFKGSYRFFLEIADKSSLSATIKLLSVKMNLLGFQAFEEFHKGIDEPVFRPIVEDILIHGSSIVEKALRDALTVPPADIGMSFLTLPSLAKTAAGDIQQQVDSEVAVAYLKLGIPHYDRVSEHPDWEAGFSGYESSIQSGFGYLLSIPGVQENLALAFDKMPETHQRILINLGMHASHIKSPSHAVMSAVLARDLGL